MKYELKEKIKTEQRFTNILPVLMVFFKRFFSHMHVIQDAYSIVFFFSVGKNVRIFIQSFLALCFIFMYVFIISR